MILGLIKYSRISLTILLIWSGCLFSNMLQAQTIHKVRGAVSDFCFFEKHSEIFISTDQGIIECIDSNNFKVKRTISFPSLVDFFGDSIRPMIHSIDADPATGTLFAIVQGKDGFRDLYRISTNKKEQVISSKNEKIMMTQVIALNKLECAFATLGNELMRYNLKTSKYSYKSQAGTSVFAQLAYKRSEQKVFIADESGTITVIDVNTGDPTRKIKDQHLDMVYSVDVGATYLISGGKDLKLVIRNLDSGKKKNIPNPFPVYCVAINKDETLAALQSDDDNTISIININSGKTIRKLKKHQSSLTKLAFIGTNQLISSGNDGLLIKWNL